MAKSTSTSAILVDLLRPFSRVFAGFLLVLSAIAVWRYPSQTDPAMPQRRTDSEAYYETVYNGDKPEDISVVQDEYARIAQEAAKGANIEGMMKWFVGEYKLERAKVLEIGAGRGHLQDVVEDYTGLDIAGSSKRFFHKKFVQASATAMPFADQTFDAAWTIWVFEHVPNPEHALIEARRVVKNGGLLLLLPAFECGEWLADGYQSRPYSAFDWKGKAYKAALPAIQIGIGFATPLVRLARTAELWTKPGPSQYRYRLLKPNYRDYWQADSDALNHLDYLETAVWFESRGDECLNCGGLGDRLTTRNAPLVIRVHKPAEGESRASR